MGNPDIHYAETLYQIMGRFSFRDTRKRKCVHSLQEVLTCLLIGIAAGRSTQKHALQYCKNHYEELRGCMPLKHGIASPSTACRLLRMVDEDDLSDIFAEWALSIVNTEDTVISVDGKGERASTNKVACGHTPYVLNAAETFKNLIVSVLPVGDKENEKTVFHETLEKISVQGSLLVADAMATDQNIIRDCLDHGADVTLQVKRNNPNLYEQLKSAIGTLRDFASEAQGTLLSDDESKARESFISASICEKNAGRIEHRTAWTTNDVSIISHTETTMPGLKTIGLIEQVRILQVRNKEGADVTPSKEDFLQHGSPRQPKPKTGDSIEDDIQIVGIISTRSLNAAEALCQKRGYWAIENSVHYVLDEVFREDRYHYSINNFRMMVLRRFAYNVIRVINLREYCLSTMKDTAYYFCDSIRLIRKYIFEGIQSFL